MFAIRVVPWNDTSRTRPNDNATARPSVRGQEPSSVKLRFIFQMRLPRRSWSKSRAACCRCMCKFCLSTPLPLLPLHFHLSTPPFSWSGHGTVQVIGKTGHESKSLLYVAKAPCQLCVISLVRQATASGSMTGLQELQELPHNPPIQTRRSAINSW